MRQRNYRFHCLKGPYSTAELKYKKDLDKINKGKGGWLW